MILRDNKPKRVPLSDRHEERATLFLDEPLIEGLCSTVSCKTTTRDFSRCFLTFVLKWHDYHDKETDFLSQKPPIKKEKRGDVLRRHSDMKSLMREHARYGTRFRSRVVSHALVILWLFKLKEGREVIGKRLRE